MSSCLVEGPPMELKVTKRKAMKASLSRKKACSFCSSQKRRCDMLYPSCSRCLDKGVDCVYSSTTSNPVALMMRNRTGQHHESSSSSSESPTDFDPNILFDTEMPWNDVALDAESFNNIFSFTERNYPCTPCTPSLSPILPPLESSYLVGAGYQGLRNFSLEPGFLYYHHLSDLSLHVDRLRQYPRIFLTTLSCPFIHNRLYASGLPPVLSATSSICALHCFRSPNIEVEIDASIRQLIQSNILGAPSTTPAEKLALGQSLFMLVCILLFEGSIPQSSLGERLLRHLMPLCDDLIEYLKSLPNVNDSQSLSEYAFVESIKLLVVLYTLAHSCYCSLRQEPCPVLNTNFFTMSLSKQIWNARTEDEWRLAKINNVTFRKYEMLPAVTEFLTTRPYSDMCFDVFIFYAICIGQEEFKEKMGFFITELPEYGNYLDDPKASLTKL